MNIFIKIIPTAPSRRPRAPAERAFLLSLAAFGKKILGFTSSLFLPLLGRNSLFVFMRTVTKTCCAEIYLKVNNYLWSARSSLFEKIFWTFFIFWFTGASLEIPFLLHRRIFENTLSLYSVTQKLLWECIFFIFSYTRDSLYSVTQENRYIL